MKGAVLLLTCLIVVCDAFKLRTLSALHKSGHARRLLCTPDAALETPETGLDTQLKPALQQVKRSKRKPTWEDKFENDPLKSDMPTEDLLPPIDPFTKWFLCFATIEKTERRQEAWLQHIQWARRSVLAQSLVDNFDETTSEAVLDVVPKVKVENAYTLLSDDCMGPKAQVLVMRANDSSAIHSYIAEEPLASHKAVRPWAVFELKMEEASPHKDEEDDWRDYLCGDLSDPYMFLTMNSNGNSNSKAVKQKSGVQGVLDRSLGYHLQSAGAPYTPPQLIDTTGHGNANPVVSAPAGTSPRVVMLGRLHHTTAGKHAEPADAAAGQLLLFNAKSRAEALRYLAADPVAQSAQGVAGKPELFDTMMLSAVNVQDVSGLNHLMPRTFGAKTQLDQVHYLDPEDLLQFGAEEGLVDLPTLPGHFERNHRLLDALQNHGISHRYTRMDESELLRSSSPNSRGDSGSSGSTGEGEDGAGPGDGKGEYEGGGAAVEYEEVSEEDLEEGWGSGCSGESDD